MADTEYAGATNNSAEGSMQAMSPRQVAFDVTVESSTVSPARG